MIAFITMISSLISILITTILTLSRYGQIVNISMEVEKNCGFITYDKVRTMLRPFPAC